MNSMEGVRRVTNRMELIQGLRTKLLKARITSILLGVIVIALSIVVAVLIKELKETKEIVNNYKQIEIELNNEIKDLKTDIKEANEEIVRLNSFDNKIDVAFELEEIVREAVGGIESITKTLSHYISSKYSIKTDIQVTDYVLDDTTGETVKVIEDNDHMFVVYVDNAETSSLLERKLTKEYYKGTERYADVITSHENTLLIRHDYK